MESERLDHLVRTLGIAGTRRALVRLLASLPLVGTLAAVAEESAARRGHRHKHKHKTKKKKCTKSGGTPKKGKPCCTGTLVVDDACQACTVCSSGCDFRKVQDAIAAADPGETIFICSGTYEEDLTIAKELTLIGAGEGAGKGNTILRGTGTASVVRVDPQGDTPVFLQRLRITGGEDHAGGGIVNNSGGDLYLTFCTVTGNTATNWGGGIANSLDGRITLTGCTVSGNTATSGDGDGGGIINLGTLALFASDITGNTAESSGGGIYNTNKVTLDATSRVTGNTADPTDPNSGGGIYNFGTVTLANTANVTGNTPDNCGGPDPVPLCSG